MWAVYIVVFYELRLVRGKKETEFKDLFFLVLIVMSYFFFSCSFSRSPNFRGLGDLVWYGVLEIILG